MTAKLNDSNFVVYIIPDWVYGHIESVNDLDYTRNLSRITLFRFDKRPGVKSSRPSIFRTMHFATDVDIWASFPTTTAIYRPDFATITK